jgi:site-specific DNA-cytosine methylase
MWPLRLLQWFVVVLRLVESCFVDNHGVASLARASQLQVRTAFMCEFNPVKQAYLSAAFPDAERLYRDMFEVAAGSAYDIKTESWSKPPRVDLLMAGYPCVSISSLCNSPQDFNDTSSKTGGGYEAVMRYIARERPKLVALENVRQMFSAVTSTNERPVDVQNKRMEALGYVSAACLKSAADFHIPQSRRRAWMMYVVKDEVRGSGADIKRTFLLFRGPPGPLPLYLVGSARPAGVARRSGHKTAKPNSRWPVQLGMLKAKLGNKVVNSNLAMLRRLPLSKSLSNRQLAVVAVAIQQLLLKGVNCKEVPVIIQVNQSLTRQSFRANAKHSPCVCPNGKYVVTGSEMWRLLSDSEHLMLQGIGLREQMRYNILAALGSSISRDCAGNAFTSSMCAAAFFTLLTHWNRK